MDTLENPLRLFNAFHVVRDESPEVVLELHNQTPRVTMEIRLLANMKHRFSRPVPW